MNPTGERNVHKHSVVYNVLANCCECPLLQF